MKPRSKLPDAPVPLPGQMDLFPDLTRYPKPTTVRVRSRNGVEDVPIADLGAWLEQHARSTTKAGA